MYDAIVVGARCAGSPTAMLLARRGYRVLLVDRAAFPSDTLSTHYIHQPGVARLKRWGLLDRCRRDRRPPRRTAARSTSGRSRCAARRRRSTASRGAYAPRRRVLDKILVDAAAAAGRRGPRAILGRRARPARAAASPAFAAARPAAHGHGEGAASSIGADGHALARRARGRRRPCTTRGPALTCAYYTYWGGVPVDGAELYPRDGRADRAPARPTTGRRS